MRRVCLVKEEKKTTDTANTKRKRPNRIQNLGGRKFLRNKWVKMSVNILKNETK